MGTSDSKNVLNEKRYRNHGERSVWITQEGLWHFLQDAYCDVHSPQSKIIPRNNKQKHSPRSAQKKCEKKRKPGGHIYAAKSPKSCKPASFCTRNGTNAQWQHIFRNTKYGLLKQWNKV